jgi:hypothetical protein
MISGHFRLRQGGQHQIMLGVDRLGSMITREAPYARARPAISEPWRSRRAGSYGFVLMICRASLS